MMLYPAMNKLTANVPNRYLLVNVVARRARQIAQEAENLGEHLDEKPVTMAIAVSYTHLFVLPEMLKRKKEGNDAEEKKERRFSIIDGLRRKKEEEDDEHE